MVSKINEAKKAPSAILAATDRLMGELKATANVFAAKTAYAPLAA